jgi:CRP/FNR family transcriptional regulator, cyclic AMP receptor protein
LEAELRALLDHPDFREGEHWHRHRVAAGQAVFREGETGSELYLILEGSVRVMGDVELEPRRRIQPGFCDLSAGALFGELALFDQEPRSATVVAVADTELVVIDGGQLLRFFDANPEVGYTILNKMLSVIVGRLRSTNKKLVSLFAWGLKAHGIEQHL